MSNPFHIEVNVKFSDGTVVKQSSVPVIPNGEHLEIYNPEHAIHGNGLILLGWRLEVIAITKEKSR